MDNLVKWIRDIAYILLPGLVYFFDLFFLILFINNQNFKELINEYWDYQTCLIILVILISYILGFTINIALQRFIWIKKPNLEKNFKENLKSKTELRQEFYAYRESLVMIRHFIISFSFLGPIIILYCSKINQSKLGICLLVACLLTVALSIIAYIQVRIKVMIINEIDKNS